MTSIEGKALTWYAEEKQLKPQLSAYPTITFKRRDTDEVVDVSIVAIVNEYNHWNENDKKARARQRRYEKERLEKERMNVKRS